MKKRPIVKAWATLALSLACGYTVVRMITTRQTHGDNPPSETRAYRSPEQCIARVARMCNPQTGDLFGRGEFVEAPRPETPFWRQYADAWGQQTPPGELRPSACTLQHEGLCDALVHNGNTLRVLLIGDSLMGHLYQNLAARILGAPEDVLEETEEGEAELTPDHAAVLQTTGERRITAPAGPCHSGGDHEAYPATRSFLDTHECYLYLSLIHISEPTRPY
eukprot:TRINITY_DN24210_c0_g1_i1.p1 TRINITY_DN24210_c0_g1~~TRINITY_DN24210_c0_g1_i1.p1  ORF type:complete len:221 (+),score=36.26 TRINITY_DN24210_c0_g1_i1:42-704(+)